MHFFTRKTYYIRTYKCIYIKHWLNLNIFKKYLGKLVNIKYQNLYFPKASVLAHD